MNPPNLLLIRHGEVEREYKSICYGQMDVPLSEAGREKSIRLAEKLCCEHRPRYIFHSGLQRTKFLATEIAQWISHDCEVIEDHRLRERDFGDWQGKSWDDIFASDPEHFHDLIEQPKSYRPPQGETTNEMQCRIVAWLDRLSLISNNPPAVPIIAISHSGPIAAACGTLLNLHARDWAPWTIRNLEAVAIDHLQSTSLISAKICNLLTSNVE